MTTCDVCGSAISRPALCSPKCRTRAFRARKNNLTEKFGLIEKIKQIRPDIDFCKHGSKPELCKFGC